MMAEVSAIQNGASPVNGGGSHGGSNSSVPASKKFKGEKVDCGELRKYLYGFEIYRQASMLRKGREVHKIYVDVHKGANFLDDRFSLTEFGTMVLDNGSVRAGRARNVRQIVVARETLYCSGTGGCKRACGGYGSCVSGCDKIKVRGHKCSFRVKLTMRLGFADCWFVEILGSHNTYIEENTPSDLDSMSNDYAFKPVNGENSRSCKASPIPEPGGLIGQNGANFLSPSSTPPNQQAMMLTPAHCHLNIPVFPESYLMSVARNATAEAMNNGNNGLSRGHMSPLGFGFKREVPAQGMMVPEMMNNFLHTGLIPRFGLMPPAPPSPPVQDNGRASKTPPPNAMDLSVTRMHIKEESPGHIPLDLQSLPPKKSPLRCEIPIVSNHSNSEKDHKVNGIVPYTFHTREAHHALDIPSTSSPLDRAIDYIPASWSSEMQLSTSTTLSTSSRSNPVSSPLDKLGAARRASPPSVVPPTSSSALLTTNTRCRKVPSKKHHRYLAPPSKSALPLTDDNYSKNIAGEDEVLEPDTKPEAVDDQHDSNSNKDEETGQDLTNRVQQLEAHVVQLRNIVLKKDGEKTDNQGRRKQQKEFDFNRYNTRHVALKVAYLGWDYQGFVVQEETNNTIEAALFEALLKTQLIKSRETSNYHRCGRTDKGVSAFGQVISIDLRTNLLSGVGVKIKEGGSADTRPGNNTTEIRYCHILNRVLPPEIRVLAWAPVDTEFSARFSCKKRTYKYYFPKGNLDIKRMNEAAAKLIGEHDFRNLCKMDVANGVVNYMRKIFKAEITITSEEPNGYSMCEMTVVGQAFLWHQIRCIVSILFLVAQGKEELGIVDELLDVEKNPRKPQYTMGSELPLVLFDCYFGDSLEWSYEADWHEENIKHLQRTWADYTIRATMIKRMLEQLEVAKVETESDIAPWNELSSPLLDQAEWLLPGNKPRIYKPLFKRPFCETLEERIDHFSKRKKMEEKGADNSESIADVTSS